MGREIKIDLNPGLTIKSVFLIMKPFTFNVFFNSKHILLMVILNLCE